MLDLTLSRAMYLSLPERKFSLRGESGSQMSTTMAQRTVTLPKVRYKSLHLAILRFVRPMPYETGPTTNYNNTHTTLAPSHSKKHTVIIETKHLTQKKIFRKKCPFQQKNLHCSSS